MILDLSDNVDHMKAKVYFEKLLHEQCAVEIKKIHKKRTNKQNRYLHALFVLYGGEWGLSLDEAKTVVKRELKYTYQKHGQWFLRKTSEMNTKELTEFIEKFRNMAAAQGFYLPSAEEMNENYVEMMKEVARIESMQSKYSY